MREIKFRLRLRGKIVGYEKWYPGSYNKNDGFYTAAPCWLYSVNGERWNPAPIFHDGKDQFTGLRDKNGKDIYEGDVLRFDEENVKNEVAGVVGAVEFERGAFRVECFEDYKTVLDTGDCCEIIGNIHENPELLKSS